MNRASLRAWRPGRRLAVLLGILAATAAVRFAPGAPLPLLGLYFLPAVGGACVLGVRAGAIAALGSCAAVFVMAAMNGGRFLGPDARGETDWLELEVWGGSLMLSSLLAGLLHDRQTRRARTLESAYRGALDLMSRLIDSVERHSENHSLRVAESAADVARALGLTDAEVEDVRVGALLHDIARLEIPVEALASAAGLAPQELEEPQGFGERGRARARLAGGSLPRVLPMLACRHERWDGTGRRGLRGREIPIGARIIAVADGFDGMVTDRAYRKGLRLDLALALLRESSGTQFDPQVVDVFVRLHEALPGDAAAAA